MALFQFSKAKAFLLLLAVVIFCMSVSTLALSAHGIAYYLNATTGGQFDYVKVHVEVWNATDQKSTSYTTHLAYQKGYGMDMSDMYALLMAGIIGALLGLLVIGATVWTGKPINVNVSLTGRNIRPTNLFGSTSTLLLDASLLLTFVPIAGYTWTRVLQSSYYIDPTLINDPQDRLTWYDSRETFTFERWNLALAGIAADDGTSAQLYALWRQAELARAFALVLFVLAFLRLGTHFWVWRRHNIAVRLGLERNGYARHDDDDVDLREKTRRRRRSRSSGYGADAVEMPAYRLSRVEAADAAVGEMPGENGSKELQGETVAVEMDGSQPQSGAKT